MINRGAYFELLVQTTKTWRIPFSLSCVTCPPLCAPYGDEALLLMKQNIIQNDVKIWNTHVERPIGNTKQKKELKEGFGEVWEKQIDDSERKKKALGELQKLQEEAREK
ncbi:uncharacterized protein LOC126598835 isoform X2 [Malus sylvestris]|uniref:uncharacterized protein LOC126598835 isoform X2 n=1 Tax=Malus sylvestris TaxID=3752 RepID=UPI0021ABF88F|nr:uncharacterized protein LOC126598835 isoform X2 [Malus sylvestris]